MKLLAPYKSLFKKQPDKRYYLVTGGRGCFQSTQKIITKKGNKQISQIKKGDMVLSYNEEKNTKEYKKVKNTFKYENKKIYRIKLKNGTEIKVTENHKFYHNGCWVKIKDLLYLFYGNMEGNTKI